MMVDADGYFSDTGQQPNIYPDPEHVAQLPWLAAAQSSHSPIAGHVSHITERSASAFQLHRNNTHDETGNVFSPENTFDSSEEHENFPIDDSESALLLKGVDKLKSRENFPDFGRVDSHQGKGTSQGGRGVKRGPRQALEPDSGFKVLYSQATDLFVARDYDRAEQCIQHAIRVNPEIFAAHSLLSAIYMERGDKDRALTALFFGAHTRPTEKQVWIDVAKLILERAGDDHLSAVRDAIYCYNRIVGLDPKDLESRRQRAALNRELGNNAQAFSDYNRVLIDLPQDIGVLRLLAELFTELGEEEKAIKPFEDCLTHCQSLEPEIVSLFDWSDVNVYVELCTISMKPQLTIQKLKAFARWLLGRLKEQYWDDYIDDDREYDAEDVLRRTQVLCFRPGKYDLYSYGLGLPLELRAKLGILRLEIGGEYADNHTKEALCHFNWLEPTIHHPGSKLFEYPDLFRDVGDALRQHGYFLEALRFYEPLKMVDLAVERSYLQDVAYCYERLQMFDQAEQCYEIILEHDASNADVQLHLTNMFELAEKPKGALRQLANFGSSRHGGYRSLKNASLQLGRAPIAIGKSRAHSSSHLTVSTIQHTSKRKASKATTQPRESLASTHELDAPWLEMKLAKDRLRRNPLASLDGWMENAKFVLDNFKSQSSFFPSEPNTRFSGYRNEAGRLPLRLAALPQRTVNGSAAHTMGDPDKSSFDVSPPTIYCGVSFEQWLDVFLEYALLVSQKGDDKLAYATLESASSANVFRHSQQWMFHINVCWLACATQLNDSETVCSVSRYFMKEYPSVTDAYRLFMALNRVCHGQSSCFNSSPSQKFILRQLKAMDLPLLQQEKSLNFGKQSTARRYQVTTSTSSTISKEMDVALLMLYGQILYSGTSYTSALNYFYRAFALDPSNSMIHLCLSLGYLHYALKRQSENRHYLIIQGLSFLLTYYNLRQGTDSVIGRQEAEFNVGRFCEILGLTHLAIESYRQCLTLSREIARSRKEDPLQNFAPDAAFCLQRLCLASGDVALANSVTRAWLII